MNGNPREEDSETTAEQQPQPAQVADAPAGVDSERQRLEEELAATRKRYDEAVRAYQALSQDREEFKQRLTRERERMLDVERGKVAATLLEAIDDLDRSLAASEGDSSPLAQGVRLIREGLLAKVQSSGIERLEVVGKPFDPNTAEATDMELTPVAEDDHRVVSEVRAGYRLRDRIIRPARVRVARYVPPAQA
jgi:molecular chaperone GrpE